MNKTTTNLFVDTVQRLHRAFGYPCAFWIEKGLLRNSTFGASTSRGQFIVKYGIVKVYFGTNGQRGWSLCGITSVKSVQTTHSKIKTWNKTWYNNVLVFVLLYSFIVFACPFGKETVVKHLILFPMLTSEQRRLPIARCRNFVQWYWIFDDALKHK